MTKKELATLIVSGLTQSQKFVCTPMPSHAPGWWSRWDNATSEEQDSMLAAYMASKHTLAELESWAEDLTAP